MAILLLRPNPNEQFRPSFIGFTRRRDLNSVQALDAERRIGMMVQKWGKTDVHAKDLPETVGEHPKLFVSKGTHSFYLQPGTNIVNPYPPEAFPAWCGQFDTPNELDDYIKSHPHKSQDKEAALYKIVGGLLAGGLPGVIGGIGAAALEGNFPWGIDSVGSGKFEKPEPEVTATLGALGKVVHPKNVTPQELVADPVKWAAKENLDISGRKYFLVVNRAAQIWWPSDDLKSGYRGRWGPRVVHDPVNRRDGMRFPEFWKMFFIALAKAAPLEFQ